MLQLVLGTMVEDGVVWGWDGAGLVWFCFLQRPRLIAVYEVRVLGRGGGAKDTVQETYSLHFFIFPHFLITRDDGRSNKMVL